MYNNSPPPLPLTPVRRPRWTEDGSASPRKRVRDATLLPPPLPFAFCAPPPPDVAELRRRIVACVPDLDGLEQCPYAQTPGAMLLAVAAAADDTDPARASRAVLWLMRAGNEHWFTCGMRAAVCEPGKHTGLLRGLLADAAQFWPADQVAAAAAGEDVVGSSSSSSSSSSRKRAEGSPATRGVLRVLRARSKAARKRTAVWGPFSAQYCGSSSGMHSDDEEEQLVADDAKCGSSSSSVYCGACRDDHSPALLMIDALLHGNLAAAQMVAETFTPSAWRIAGHWSVGGGGGSSGGDSEKKRLDGENDVCMFVPASAIRLSASIVVRASVSAPAASREELDAKVRECLRTAQKTWMPELLEDKK
jgi:hypothetical protein